jgi:hypothetical protein
VVVSCRVVVSRGVMMMIGRRMLAVLGHDAEKGISPINGAQMGISQINRSSQARCEACAQRQSPSDDHARSFSSAFCCGNRCIQEVECSRPCCSDRTSSVHDEWLVNPASYSLQA